MLDAIIIKDNGVNLVPELYYVTLDKVCDKESYHVVPLSFLLEDTIIVKKSGKLKHITMVPVYILF